MTQPTDAELLAAARTDAAAFRRFYDRYADRVYGYHLRRTREREAAHDLTAETFAQAWVARTRFRDRLDGTAGPPGSATISSTPAPPISRADGIALASRAVWCSSRAIVAAVLGAAAAVAAIRLSTDDVARSLPAGTAALIGTDPTCTVVEQGVEYHCVLAKAPRRRRCRTGRGRWSRPSTRRST